MKNLLLLLVLANILYFIWEMVVEEPPTAGVAIVRESELGPPLEVSRTAEAASSFGAMPGSPRQSDLSAMVGRSCVSIGPFTENAEAQRVFQEHQQEGMRANVRSTEGQLFVGHWVQIRNIPDRDTGNLMLERLVAGGMPDAYLVPTDDEGLKISLGLFSEMSRAERVELQAEALEFDAEISARMRDATVFFVDIALPPGRGAGAMIEEFGEDKVLLRERATCPRAGAGWKTRWRRRLVADQMIERGGPTRGLQSKLWGGFSRSALAELERIRISHASQPKDAAQAAWILASSGRGSVPR